MINKGRYAEIFLPCTRGSDNSNLPTIIDNLPIHWASDVKVSDSYIVLDRGKTSPMYFTWA